MSAPRPNPMTVAVPVLSPSLGKSAGPAFEMKFLVGEEVAGRLETRLRREFALDAHGDPALDGAYLTSTLYCDTEAMDVFRQSPGYSIRKFRLRRYGKDSRIFLERKTKWGDRVHKRRSSIVDLELPALKENGPASAWPGHWFRRRLQIHRLAPACQIGYERLAYVAPGLRVTLDRKLRCAPARDWVIGLTDEGLPILVGSVILEFKYAVSLPAVCKSLIQDFNLLPRRVSKYRSGMEAWGHRSST